MVANYSETYDNVIPLKACLIQRFRGNTAIFRIIASQFTFALSNE
jgi:hypothetical protein